MSMSKHEFDFAAYAATIAALTADGLSGTAGTAAVGDVMARVADRAEATLAAHLPAGAVSMTACGPGCATCCTVNVTVLIPEAIAIARHLAENVPPPALAPLGRRVHETARAVRWLEDDERIRAGHPCPFLDRRGWCTIHPVRPLTCRALTSTDPHRCRDALAAQAAGEYAPLLANLFQKFLLEQTYRGVATGLAQSGLDDSGRELTRSVGRFLGEPELVADFLRGWRIAFPD